jgi:hypothetical protein
MNGLIAQTPSFVPGQALMRFAEGTPQRAKILEVSRTNPLDLSGLETVTDDLRARIRVPLYVEKLGSGDWLTLAVDRQPLAEAIEQFLRGENGVIAVTRQDATSGQTDGLRFLITIAPGSDLQRVFERRAENDGLAAIVDRWTAAVSVPLRETGDPGHLVIEVDWSAATLELVDRLSALPEVEAAQPNYSQMR